MRPPIDIAAIEEVMPSVLASGHRILQTHKYASTDEAHTDYLLRHFDPPQGALVLDAGCGVGEVSRLMSARRPDLSFVLMNLSAVQLAHCPVGEQYVPMLDDCHACRLHDCAVDAVMFSSALCQMDIPVALVEARRVLVTGGVMMVNEMVREYGDPEEMESKMAARVLRIDKLLGEIEAAGFSVGTVDFPDYDASHFSAMLDMSGIGYLLDPIKPVIIRALAQTKE